MPRKVKETALTKKQSQFVEAMADPQTASQTKAAIKAGCSPRSARVTASRWLTNANISEKIQRRKDEAARLAGINYAQIQGAIIGIAFSSPEDAFDAHGNFDYQKAVESGAIDFIKKYKRTPTAHGVAVTVEFYSRADALYELAVHLGMRKKDAEPPADVEAVARQAVQFLEMIRNFDCDFEGAKQKFIETLAGRSNINPELLRLRVKEIEGAEG